jgi:hypothetical protein
MRPHRPSNFARRTALFFLTLSVPAVTKGAATVIAISQPSGSTGTIQWVFESPDINDSGQTAFSPILRNIGRSLLLHEGTANTELIRQGNPAPDGNGMFFSFANDPVLNNAGQVAFRGGIRQTSGGFNDDIGVFLADEENVVQIAREGNSVPDQAFVFDNFQYPVLNENGHVAFQALLRNSGFRYGIYRSVGTTLEEVARFDQLRPDGMGIFGYFGGVGINNPGQLAFLATDPSQSNEGPYLHLYVESNGTLTEIARQGQSAPGANTSFHSFPWQSFALNDLGDLVFHANVLTQGSTTKKGIYLSAGSAIVPIVQEGDAIPNGAGTFTELIDWWTPSLNSHGETVFWARFTDGGAEHDGLFIGSADGVVEVARDDTPAPDGAGTVGADFSGITEINDAGQFAFTAWDYPDPNGRAAYFFDGIELSTIARLGQPLAGSTLDRFTSNSGGDQININASGQVVFQFELADDRTGILKFTPDNPLPGDFNQDGAVDAADYVVWRRSGGTQGAFQTWRANFGRSADNGSATSIASSPAAPEPASLVLVLCALAWRSTTRQPSNRKAFLCCVNT